MASDEDYEMYKNRPEWSDMKPIKQNDGPAPIVKIAYPIFFEDVYDYFRAVVAADELSERALELTEEAINMNPANYTVWQYRRRILQHLKSDLKSELSFSREIIESNPKNYQVWHHRRVIVEWSGNASKELRLTEIVFSQDAKNYHAWEHRQWTLRTFKIFDGEFDFIDRLLDEDIRNNSAWNHRYFVINQTTGLTPSVLVQEVEYARRAILKLQDNESPWTYMKGVLKHTEAEDKQNACWASNERWCLQVLASNLSKSPLPSHEVVLLDTDSDVDDNALPSLAVLTSIPKGDVSAHLLVGLLDCLVYRAKKLEDGTRRKSYLAFIVQICNILADVHDKIRCRYWRYFSKQITKSCGASS